MTTQVKKSAYKPSAPAVEQAAQILLCLGKANENDLGLTAICRDIGIHKSKGFSILNALARYDLVTKDEKTKTYCLGPALMPLARKAREKLDINDIAKQHLQSLAKKTKTSVLLGIISHDQLYISGKYDGNELLSVTARQYQSLHITHGAHGKAIFAFLDEASQNRIFDSGQLFFHGSPENLDKKRLEQELKDCRSKGFATDNGDMTPGITAVSAPIFNHNNQVTAAIVLVGTFTEDKFSHLGEITAATAKLISKKAGAVLP